MLFNRGVNYSIKLCPTPVCTEVDCQLPFHFPLFYFLSNLLNISSYHIWLNILTIWSNYLPLIWSKQLLIWSNWLRIAHISIAPIDWLFNPSVSIHKVVKIELLILKNKQNLPNSTLKFLFDYWVNKIVSQKFEN